MECLLEYMHEVFGILWHVQLYTYQIVPVTESYMLTELPAAATQY